MRFCAGITLSVLSTLLASCDRGEATRNATFEVRDSAGVTIVDNGPLDLGRELLAAPEPVVEIGVVDGAEAYQLFEVTDAKRLPDGGFAVVNAGSRELKIYDASGAYRATAGGPGQGPSEFGYPVAVRALAADTVMVQDRTDRVYFTADGVFLRRTTTSRQDLMALNERTGGMSEGGYWMPDGTLFTQVYQWDAHPAEVGPPFRPEMTFVRVGADLASVDTLGVFGGILQQYVDVGEERPSSTVPPFARNTSWGTGSADGTVVAADNALSQIELFAPSGAHTIVRWEARPAAVTGAEVEAWKERTRSMEWAQQRLPRLERAWLAMDVPETKTHFGAAVSGTDGRVWLGPADDYGEGWLVFGADGRYEGRASLPALFRPMDSGPGWVLGLFRDANDVEFVRLYELVSG